MRKIGVCLLRINSFFSDYGVWALDDIYIHIGIRSCYDRKTIFSASFVV